MDKSRDIKNAFYIIMLLAGLYLLYLFINRWGLPIRGAIPFNNIVVYKDIRGFVTEIELLNLKSEEPWLQTILPLKCVDAHYYLGDALYKEDIFKNIYQLTELSDNQAGDDYCYLNEGTRLKRVRMYNEHSLGSAGFFNSDMRGSIYRDEKNRYYTFPDFLRDSFLRLRNK